MNNLVSILSRIGFALVMLAFAFSHFAYPNAMAVMMPPFFPKPVLWVYLSGASLTLASIAFIINRKVKLAAYLLGLLLLIYVFTIHLPHLMGGDQGATTMILKDTALATGAFFIGSRSVRTSSSRYS